MFNLMIAHDLKSTQIDFRNAFVHSTLPEPIFIQPPSGLNDSSKKGHFLKVIKSLYGDRRAPQLWFKHLQAGLEKQGFKPSQHDPCLFIRHDVAFVVYVDDGIFSSKSQKVIEQCIAQLIEDGYDLDPERATWQVS
jgi:hypothetical protein